MSEKNYLSKILDYLHDRLSLEERKTFEDAAKRSKQSLDHLAHQELNDFLRRENTVLKKRKAARLKWFVIGIVFFILSLLVLLFLN